MDKKKIKKLKKAYYEGKLSQFLDGMLARGEKIDQEVITELLTGFEEERKKMIAQFEKYLVKEETPSVDVLFDKNSDPAQKEAWIKGRNHAIDRAKNILKATFQAVSRKEDIDVQKFSDYAHELTALTYFLDQDVVYKKRNWKIRQMELMEDYRCSRKEAEDHSMITNEYVEYKNAYNLREEVENFIINARKELARFQ